MNSASYPLWPVRKWITDLEILLMRYLYHSALAKSKRMMSVRIRKFFLWNFCKVQLLSPYNYELFQDSELDLQDFEYKSCLRQQLLRGAGGVGWGDREKRIQQQGREVQSFSVTSLTLHYLNQLDISGYNGRCTFSWSIVVCMYVSPCAMF